MHIALLGFQKKTSNFRTFQDYIPTSSSYILIENRVLHVRMFKHVKSDLQSTNPESHLFVASSLSQSRIRHLCDLLTNGHLIPTLLSILRLLSSYNPTHVFPSKLLFAFQSVKTKLLKEREFLKFQCQISLTATEVNIFSILRKLTQS